MVSEGEFSIHSWGTWQPGMPVSTAGDSHSMGGDPKLESADVAWEHVSAQVRPRGLSHT